MSIRHSLLALLHDQPMYGYQLRSEFEERTGSTWPLNIGQVYTTLDRLERDGLAVKDGDDGEGHVVYRITASGKTEVSQWFAAPVVATNPPRNELAIKLSLAMTLDNVDVEMLLQAQRTASMRNLQTYTRQRREAAKSDSNDSQDVAWILVLDSLVFGAEAEIRWLDHCEGWLRKHRFRTSKSPASHAAEPTNATKEPTR
ncbi:MULTISPECIES: PadR family transcriptional regulator [Micrococcaceae]|uniref:PadR family transcriptional regulator n=1 Tax=Micrococcaceae TaxID=1268 RepID=UPI00103621B4|nr:MULTISPECIES: PadR family transcriptional regulator [Micrococcaceae]TAP25948.1 PadR family transcriptional regulator [Arthrobacter sp. S41]UXN31869.1 PadR family transcriptional regulator [Glutamicibacter sp. M10]